MLTPTIEQRIDEADARLTDTRLHLDNVDALLRLNNDNDAAYNSGLIARLQQEQRELELELAAALREQAELLDLARDPSYLRPVEIPDECPF